MTLPIIAAALAGLTVAVGLMGLAPYLPTAHARTRTRIAALAGEPSMPYERQAPALVDDRISSVRALDAFLSGKSWTVRTASRLQASGLPLRVGEYAALRMLSLAGGLVLGRMLAAALSEDAAVSVLMLAGGAVLGLMLPPWYVSRRVRQRRAAIEGQLVELCEVMSSMLQSGYGYLQALTAVANELERPMSEEVGRMLDRIRLGAEVDEALAELNERLESSDFELVATAISLQRTSGGNLAEILRGVAETVRDRLAFRREVSALTSKERYSAVVVAGFPVLLVGLLCMITPEIYTRLFTDVLGRVILGIALTLDFAGYVIVKRLTALEV